ncbi:MAG: HD domain-containing protein [Gammaproteobacteria bacterium]|jgi:HD-GYP domain-containing protein (c-di-GMP phosphodiesterase class II)
MKDSGQMIHGVTPEVLEQRYKQLVVASDKLKFTITEDIKNINGALLVKSGKSIDQATCEKLLNHKLKGPLDDYLTFTHQVTEASLVEDVISVASDVMTGTAIDFSNIVKTVSDIVKGLQFDKTILNKLTVYKYDSADNFDHSLSVALLGTEIGKALNFSLHQLTELFGVCLFHDIGEMHIEKSIYGKDDLNANDFRIITTHPVLSYVLMRESKTAFSGQVLSAVLNHHERLDESGYPRCLGEKHINRYARIVALVDTYDALRRKGRNFVDALWAISIQGHCRSISGETITPAFDPELIEVLQGLMINATAEPSCDIPIMEQKDQLQALLFQLNSINSDVVLLWEGVVRYLDNEAFPRWSKQLQQAQSYLYKVKDLILASSGFVGVNLDSLLSDENVLVDARKDLYRMAPELKNQLARIKSMLSVMDGCTQDSQLANLISLNRAAYKKCSDFYRTMVVSSTVH